MVFLHELAMMGQRGKAIWAWAERGRTNRRRPHFRRVAPATSPHDSAASAAVTSRRQGRQSRSSSATAPKSASAIAESMGFIIDNLHYRDRSPEEREELVGSLPCFRPLTGKKKAPPEPSRQDKLAKLLSAF